MSTAFAPTGTFAASLDQPMHDIPAVCAQSIDEARNEVSSLAMHLEALMLTNRALLAQLEEAKQRAATVDMALRDGGEAARQQAQRAAQGRRGREEASGSNAEEEERPRYRCAERDDAPVISILSSDGGSHDEFDDVMTEDEAGSLTFRSSSEVPRCFADEDEDEWGKYEWPVERVPFGQLQLAQLKEVVAALGSLAALGEGAKDGLVLAQLDRLRACGF